MKQKSSFLKALGIMLLSVLCATQANAQTVSYTHLPRIGWMTGGKSALWTDEDIADVITDKAKNCITYVYKRQG